MSIGLLEYAPERKRSSRQVSNKSYSDLLKDPRWQKKRLAILERDGWKCRACGDGEETLHVHHCYYEASREPWDYPDKSLVVLCESCHESEKSEREEYAKYLQFRMGQHGYLADDILCLADVVNMLEGGLENKNYTVVAVLRGALCQKGWTKERLALSKCLKKIIQSYYDKKNPKGRI